VALVVKDGRVVLVSLVGDADREAGRPMARDTLFRIASMTKAITSVATMQLVEEGKLSLDDPLSKYIPAFKEMKVFVKGASTQSAQKPILIKHLLTHTSGIGYRMSVPKEHADWFVKAGVCDGVAECDRDLAGNCNRLASVPLEHEPGQAYTYGLNTDVLGRVVEVVTGKDLDAVFHERIFEPLAMTDTSFWLPDAKKGRLAALYKSEPSGLFRYTDGIKRNGSSFVSCSFYYAGPKRLLSGGGGLISSADDYARFLQMLVNGGELDGKRLLQAQTVKMMGENQIGALTANKQWGHGDKFGFGFGVWAPASAIKIPESVSSISWGGMFYTYFWADPERKVIGLLLTQTYPHVGDDLRMGFKKRVYQALR
jgi:CubicO group peptidase (beta-lactamase class C family)